jgi:hypothetical protein
MAGYSAGVALACRRRCTPVLPDVAALALLAAALLLAGDGLPRLLLIPAALAAALIAGAIAGVLRGRSPAPEMESAPEAGPEGAWRRFAARMGGFQARMILGLVYLTVAAPFALAARLSRAGGAPPAGEGTRWRTRPAPVPGLDAARRQH